MRKYRTPKNTSGFDQIWTNGHELILSNSNDDTFHVYVAKDGVVLRKKNSVGNYESMDVIKMEKEVIDYSKKEWQPI